MTSAPSVHPPTMPLHTRRLAIREYVAADAAQVFETVKDQEYWQYHGAEPPTVTQVEALIQWAVHEQKLTPRLNYFFAATRKDNGALIGEAVLKITNPVTLQGEIGFGVAPQLWKQGFATEIGHAMLELAFGHFKLHRVSAQCAPDNKASIRVMQKLGMAREGLLRDLYQARGKWWSAVIYSVLDSEYAKIRSVKKS